MDKHNRIAWLAPVWLQRFFLTLALVGGSTKAISDAIDTTLPEREQATSALSMPSSSIAAEEHCYVVNLESSTRPIVISPLRSVVDAQRYVIYTSRFNLDGRNWHRLRVGFFASNSEAQAMADALEKQYPQAWVAVASNEEVANARASIGTAPPAPIAARKPLRTSAAEGSGALPDLAHHRPSREWPEPPVVEPTGAAAVPPVGAAHEGKAEAAALEPASTLAAPADKDTAATAAQAPAADQELRYPGFMWSQVRQPSDVFDEDGNSIVEGAIQQGVDWARLGSNTWLNTFFELALKRDSDDLDWNNENKLSVGGKLRYFGINRTLIAVGAKYDLVNRTKSNKNEDGFTYFVNWYSYWNLLDLTGSSADSPLPLGFPGTTWGQLRYPASQFDEETSDTLVEGAIEQGIDWLRVSEDGALNTFVLVDYTFDSKKLEWNNKIKFAPGAKFKAFVAKNALLEIGAMYRWHHRTQSNRTKSDPVFFLNWSTSWDFGEFARKSFGKAE